MPQFKTVLYLDDMRVPLIQGIDVVRNYADFVLFLQTSPMPDLISFDHDLAYEHYPRGENKAGDYIPYESYREKTGFDCARWIVEQGLPLRAWNVHSYNVQGRINIENVLRQYAPLGEQHGLAIPYSISDSRPL